MAGAQLHSNSPGAPARLRNQSGASIQLGGLTITHRDTPGHAADGVTYLISGWPEIRLKLRCGRHNFAGSMGGGNGAWDLARQKVRDEILALPEKYLDLPRSWPLDDRRGRKGA